MALIKCKECGEQISTKADACPKCGAKPSKKTSALTWLVLILVILGVYLANLNPSPTGSSSSSAGTAVRSATTPNTAEVKVREPSWNSTRSKDEMTGKRSSYAVSPTVASKASMSFPYQGTNAWLAVGCDKGTEWSFIGFTKAPNLNNTETKDGYNLIRTRFKWDDNVETVTLVQKWGAEFIHFQNERNAISRIAESTTAVLELDWHGQRPVHFEFPLRGSSDALSKIRKECSEY